VPVVGWLLIAALARASDGVAAWEAYHDARLAESLGGAPLDAVRAYEQVLREVRPDEPLRGAALCALGEARAALGRVDAARVAWTAAREIPASRGRAGELLAAADLLEGRVERLPMRMDFERAEPSAHGPWVVLSDGVERSSLSVVERDGARALQWKTRVDARPERIGLGVGPGVSVARMMFRVRAEKLPARIVVRLHDGGGAVWEAADVLVPVGRWLTVDVSPATLQASRGRVRWFEVSNVAGEGSDVRGDAEVLLDDVELR
jgi:hypothetical protein